MVLITMLSSKMLKAKRRRKMMMLRQLNPPKKRLKRTRLTSSRDPHSTRVVMAPRQRRISTMLDLKKLKNKSRRKREKHRMETRKRKLLW